MSILVSDVIEKIEEDIVFGQRRPRERLVEDDLLVQFKAKKHVIREALTSLERMGLVEKPKNKGAQVRDYPPDDVKQIFIVRKLLETEAARIMPLPMDQNVLHGIKKIQKSHFEAVKNNNLKISFRSNIEFYQLLFSACGNSYLADVIKSLALKSLAIKFFSFANPELLQRALINHQTIVQSLENSDRDSLIKVCSEHLEACMTSYLDEHENFFGTKMYY